MGVGDDRVAEIRDPAHAGRPLHGRADEVDRVRRRGRDHDVDAVVADEADRGGDRGEVPGDVLVGDERAAAEQPRLRAERAEALPCRTAPRPACGRSGRRSARGGPRPGSARGARRRGGSSAGRRGRARASRSRARQVLRQLQRTLHASAACRREVEADEQRLHPGDGTGGSPAAAHGSRRDAPRAPRSRRRRSSSARTRRPA